MNTSLSLLLAFAFSLSLAAAEPAPAGKLATALAEEAFLEREADHVWTAPEIAQLEKIAASGADPRVRVRATRFLIEAAGHARAAEQQQPIVDAAFRYMEQHLGDATIRQMLAAPGMTHYTTSSQADGSLWFLIESIHAENRGGLNFRWDAAKKEVALEKAWGKLTAR